MGRFPRVTHPSAARQQEQAPLLPLDLHVLGLPPAFNLSHDQTLQFNTFGFGYFTATNRLCCLTFLLLGIAAKRVSNITL